MILLTLVLVGITILAFFYHKTVRPSNFPPGPQWYPFTGTTDAIRKLAKKHGGVHKALDEMSKIYKSKVIGLRFGHTTTVSVHDDKTLKEVLTREEFQSRPTTFFSTLRSFGTNKGITMTNGELWTTQRRFLLRHLRDVGFGKERMDDMIMDEVDSIVAQLDNNESASIGRVFATSVLNVIWALLAGERLTTDQAKLQNLLQLMAKRTKWFDMSGGWLNLFPWLRFIAPKATGYELISHINGEMQQLFVAMIEDHKKEWYDGRNDDVIYSFLTEMNNNTHESFTDDQLVMICADLFFGGATTTSTSLEFVILCMLLYPDVQKKVHECIDKAYISAAMPQYKDRHLIPYVEATIYEAQRHYLATPITGPRIATRDTTLDQYTIPKGTTIMINNYSSNFNPKTWGDPHAFRPERFIDANGKAFLPNYFYPFNIGKRKCPADTLARSCLFTFFAGVMKTYELTLRDKSQKLTGIEVPGITISPEPFEVCFKRRHVN